MCLCWFMLCGKKEFKAAQKEAYSSEDKSWTKNKQEREREESMSESDMEWGKGVLSGSSCGHKHKRSMIRWPKVRSEEIAPLSTEPKVDISPGGLHLWWTRWPWCGVLDSLRCSHAGPCPRGHILEHSSMKAGGVLPKYGQWKPFCGAWLSNLSVDSFGMKCSTVLLSLFHTSCLPHRSLRHF